MPLSLSEWQTKLESHWRGWWADPQSAFQALGIDSLYFAIAGVALYPLVDNPDDLRRLLSLPSEGRDIEIIANTIRQWTTEHEAAQSLAHNAQLHSEIVETIDAILQKLGALPQVQKGLNATHQEWFARKFSADAKQAGSRLHVHEQIGGNVNRSVIKTGDNNQTYQITRNISTGGGAYFEGGVNTGGGDFVSIVMALEGSTNQPALDMQNFRDLILNETYGEAASLLSSHISRFPEDMEAHLLYAISLVAGQSLDKLDVKEMKRIETHLVRSRSRPKTYPLATIVLAIVKHDYYLINGLDEGEPSFNRLRTEVHNISSNQFDLTLLKHIKITHRIKQQLNIGW